MKFVLIFGPQAAGKMTVGHELSRITNLKLFHNHMTIDLLHPFFGFNSDMWRLTTLFREEIFKSFSRSDQYGMIFTYVWAFNKEEDWKFVEKVCHIFDSQGADIYFIELEADLNERLKRNRTPYRLEQKPTKRNVEQSERNLLDSMDILRLNSEEGELNRENYIKINNTEISAKEVAEKIKNHFGL